MYFSFTIKNLGSKINWLLNEEIIFPVSFMLEVFGEFEAEEINIFVGSLGH